MLFLFYPPLPPQQELNLLLETRKPKMAMCKTLVQLALLKVSRHSVSLLSLTHASEETA